MTVDGREAEVARAIAQVAAIPLFEGDHYLLVQALDRYFEVAAPLRTADLDGIEPASNDPRAGW